MRPANGRALRIAIIGALRHGLREPIAGGLERHTVDLATALRARGHDVTVFASGDADPELGVEPICPTESQLELSRAAMADVSMLSSRFMVEHDAYLALMLRLREERFDVIHDNSIHYLPLAMAASVPAPTVKVLHTPPTPWLESAMRHRGDRVTLVSVSPSNAEQWTQPVDAVIPNGIDLDRWAAGPGGGAPLWFGRLVPEKAPHLALQAAHAADLPLDLAGPIGSRRWFDAEVAPLLDDRRRHLGHLDRPALAARLARASTAVITPMWAEPYGLVVAEALACGTPVAGFAAGALPWLVDDETGVLVAQGDTDALAEAMHRAAGLDRAACRSRAEAVASLEVMAQRYEALYHEVAARQSPVAA